ncbi:MAG: zinc ABC transporter substrate-binding protein, partial [Candidatus Magasanikiibacteriota bacterium]
FYPLYFFASQIGGDKAQVINITPAGIEPHDYEPKAQDMAKIENSSLLILNGGGLESWGKNVEININPEHTKILTVGDGLLNRQITENGKESIDPHIWLSPEVSIKIVDKITEGFISVDFVNKDYYLANADILKERLSNLSLSYKQGLSNCVGKNIITSHTAFGYLAATYGFNQVSIAGLSPDAEPSTKQLVDIVKFAKLNNVKFIFFESLVSPKLSETIANEIGAQTLVLNPLEGLTADEVTQGKDYFSEMQNNLLNLEIALQCKQ